MTSVISRGITSLTIVHDAIESAGYLLVFLLVRPLVKLVMVALANCWSTAVTRNNLKERLIVLYKISKADVVK